MVCQQQVSCPAHMVDIAFLFGIRKSAAESFS
jgi:hypothetical protein